MYTSMDTEILSKLTDMVGKQADQIGKLTDIAKTQAATIDKIINRIDYLQKEIAKLKTKK